MQLILTLSSETSIVLPLANSRMIQGMIYNALRNDKKYAFNLHNKGNEFSKRKYKLFNFSEIQGFYKVEEKNIIYPSDIRIEIRSVDPHFMQVLLSEFSKGDMVKLGPNTVEIKDIQLKDKKIWKETVKIKTISPITVYSTEQNGHTVYFSPEDEHFYTSILNNAKRKMSSYFGNDESFRLEIRPCENANFFKRATHFKETFITAWHGEFYLTGSLETLNFLYETGLGSKNSQGFGMFEILP